MRRPKRPRLPHSDFQGSDRVRILAAAAPGSAGEVKLSNVPDKDAAMLMAIVAHKLNKPLNELRFKSIKEVK